MSVGKKFLPLMASGALLLGGCDFEVINPGPVQDVFLNDPTAFDAIVNGMGRDLADAMNYVAFIGGAVSRELHPGGGSGQFGIGVFQQQGYLRPEDTSTEWNLAQRARWSAEDGLRRMEEVLDEQGMATSKHAAQAYLWAGYANRTLGENMCQAVIDGGPAQPRDEYLKRAEQHFTRAIQIATATKQPAIQHAATAGRAAVRVHLGNWEGATADARMVPADFVFQLHYHDIGDQEQFNRIFWAGAGRPYKSHTVWNTVYEKYFEQTNDPRVAFTKTGEVGDAATTCCGSVPFFRQEKYTRADSDMNLSSGREMQLILAESLLRGGNWREAVSLINELRAGVGAPAVEAADATEAWTRLKRERGVELWLEGRRLGDLRRWKEGDTPGALDVLELPGEASNLERQDVCFPIPNSERYTNPKVG